MSGGITAFDVRPFLTQNEGQHYERKSLFEGPREAPHSRTRKAVRDQVAKQVAAFANAEGGVLILGIEDDGRPSGHCLSAEARAAVLEAPQSRLLPPQPPGFAVIAEGVELLVFDVPQCDVAVQVIGDGFPLRIGDSTVQASESQISALKFRGLAESWEARPSLLPLAALDAALLERARRAAGYADRSDEAYLLQRKLADRRGRQLLLRQGAELLFAAEGPEHPNAGVRIFRVVGTARRTGARHNVEELPRIEGNLPQVLEATFAAVRGLLRRPARLRGTRFEPTPEYPDFCWIEAVLNAVAHRDYASQGRTTELWFFDDRLEVVSPGGLLPEITLEEILHGERAHASRNPRIVRALVDLGYMRDQGEGIPRIFEEMAAEALPSPDIAVSSGAFRIVLRNLADGVELPSELPPDRGDRHGAARLAMTQPGDRGELPADRVELPSDRGELPADRVEQPTDGVELPADGVELPADRVEQPTDGVELPPDRGDRHGAARLAMTQRGDGEELDEALLQRIRALGQRPRKAALRAVLLDLCARPRRAGELAGWLGITPQKLVERHLSPLVDEGRLVLRYPDSPTHPAQAYQRSADHLGELDA